MRFLFVFAIFIESYEKTRLENGEIKWLASCYEMMAAEYFHSNAIFGEYEMRVCLFSLINIPMM